MPHKSQSRRTEGVKKQTHTHTRAPTSLRCFTGASRAQHVCHPVSLSSVYFEWSKCLYVTCMSARVDKTDRVLSDSLNEVGLDVLPGSTLLCPASPGYTLSCTARGRRGRSGTLLAAAGTEGQTSNTHRLQEKQRPDIIPLRVDDLIEHAEPQPLLPVRVLDGVDTVLRMPVVLLHVGSQGFTSPPREKKRPLPSCALLVSGDCIHTLVGGGAAAGSVHSVRGKNKFCLFVCFLERE